MADYSAKIELIVKGQQQVKALETQITSLQKQIKELTRLDVSGVFEAEPMRSAVAGLRAEKDKLAKATRDNVSTQKQLNKSTERQLLNQIKLNAAVDLYERKIKQVERSNAATQKQFAGRIEEIGKAFEFFKGKGSATGVRAVATELGRIVEYENEILLTERKREANARRSREYARELNALEAQGLDIKEAMKKFDDFARIADSNKIKQAAIYEDRLKEQLGFLRLQSVELRKQLEVEQQRLKVIRATEQARSDAARASLKAQAQRRGSIQNAGFGLQGPALPPSAGGGGGRGPGRLANVALGAGFPLLFGGGPGAVLGGAAGGLVGGPAGFAAQIALSAIGQQFDQFFAAVAETSVALTSAAGTFDLVKEKSLFSSEAIKKRAYELEELGKVEELATLLTTDLAKQLGSQGVLALQDAGKETKEFTRLVNLLFTQLSAFVAGPLSDFLSFINKALGSITTNVQFGAFKESLQGEDLAKFAAIEREVRGTRKKNIRGSDTQEVLGTLTTEKQAEILKRATAAGLAPKVTGLTTFEDTQTIKPPKGRTGKSPAEREAERVAKALINQRAVTLEIQRQSEFSAKIAAAELAKDPVLVRKLQGEQQLAELGVQTAKQLELEKNTSVQLAIAKGAQAKADLIRQETAQEIAQIEQRRQEQFDNTLAALTYQVEYESAVTREKREQLELEEEIRKAKGQGFTPEQVNKIAEQTKRRQAQQRPLQKYMTDLEKSLNDTEGKVVQLAQTIENELSTAMSSAITGIITGTTTVEEAFSQMFLNIGKAFIDMATQMLAQQLILSILKGVIGGSVGGAGAGGGGGNANFQPSNIGDNYGSLMNFADGGYPPVGQASLVGENGPELFVPGRQGAIVPNDIFAATRAALNKGGTSGAGAFEENAQALAVSTSYTRERVMEKDRQTMLTGAGGSMLIQTEVINNVEYATVDQVAQIAATSAKQARAQVFADMRNKPSTRASLGMR